MLRMPQTINSTLSFSFKRPDRQIHISTNVKPEKLCVKMFIKRRTTSLIFLWCMCSCVLCMDLSVARANRTFEGSSCEKPMLEKAVSRRWPALCILACSIRLSPSISTATSSPTPNLTSMVRDYRLYKHTKILSMVRDRHLYKRTRHGKGSSFIQKY